MQLKLAQSSQYVKYSLHNSPTVVSSLRSAIHRRLWPPGRQVLWVRGRGQRGEVIVEPQVSNVVGVCPPPPRNRVRSLEDYFLRHAVSVCVPGRGGGLRKFSSDLRRDQGTYHRRILWSFKRWFWDASAKIIITGGALRHYANQLACPLRLLCLSKLYLPWGQHCLAQCLNRFLNVKGLVGAFFP